MFLTHTRDTIAARLTVDNVCVLYCCWRDLACQGVVACLFFWHIVSQCLTLEDNSTCTAVEGACHSTPEPLAESFASANLCFL